MTAPNKQRGSGTLIAAGLVIGLIIGAIGVYAAAPRSSSVSTVTSTVNAAGAPAVPGQVQTVTTTSTNTQFVTTTTFVTVTTISTYVPHGSQAMLSSTTEIIPQGDKSITLSGMNFPYNGSLTVTYTATQAVSISLSYGQTTIATPNSETGTDLLIPVQAGSPQLDILNGACSLLGCPSITVTVSITYSY